jgi:hypothetical protein
LDIGRAGERDSAARGGGGCLPCRVEGYTRERAPLDWAATQNNLGNALWALGARESATARLEEASRPIAWLWRNARASGRRSTGQRHRATSAATLDIGRAGGREGAARGGGGCLPCRTGGIYARSSAARLGEDAEKPGRRALDVGPTEEITQEKPLRAVATTCSARRIVDKSFADDADLPVLHRQLPRRNQNFPVGQVHHQPSLPFQIMFRTWCPNAAHAHDHYIPILGRKGI